jgi:multimeric flavodoxin WrbA
MHAPPKSGIPIITPDILEGYDAFLFGIPTRYGNFPAQFKAFWDSTGQQWAGGKFWGKYAGVFVSTAGHGGGQESTVMNTMSTLAHHGIIYVPLGYAKAFGQLTNLSEVHGGSPWGAGTFAVSNPCSNYLRKKTDNIDRVVMGLVCPVLWSWRLPPFRANPLEKLSTGSITHDYMIPQAKPALFLKQRRHRTQEMEW